MSTSPTIAEHDLWLDRRQALHRLLRAQQDLVRGRCRSLRETPPREATDGADDEERAAQELEVGLDIALIEMSSRQLQEIEMALQLLEEGSYGRCLDCDEPILPARLQARPFAVRCRTCQKNVEEDAQEPRRSAGFEPTKADLALAGSVSWGGGRRAASAPKPRRPHRAMAVPLTRPLSYGGVSL